MASCSPGQFIITTPAGLETEARQELRRILPGARFHSLLFKGNLLLLTDLPQEAASARIADAGTTCVAAVIPVQRRVPVSASALSLPALAAAAAEIGRIRPKETFIVRCRRRGRHDWRARDLERIVAEQLAASTSGLGEYEAETDWHVTVQVYQDMAFVGVNRPDHMVQKTPLKQRKYRPGQRPMNRAQWKLQEALQIFAIRPAPESRALDLGSAPGGWAEVLAGLVREVVAVDPAELDPKVASRANVRHLRCRAEALLENPEGWGQFDLLTCDLNRDPEEVSKLLCQLAPLLKPGALTIMTVKYVTKERRKHEREARAILSSEYEAIRLRRLPHNAWETTAVMRRRGAVCEAPK